MHRKVPMARCMPMYHSGEDVQGGEGGGERYTIGGSSPVVEGAVLFAGAPPSARARRAVRNPAAAMTQPVGGDPLND